MAKIILPGQEPPFDLGEQISGGGVINNNPSAINNDITILNDNVTYDSMGGIDKLFASENPINFFFSSKTVGVPVNSVMKLQVNLTAITENSILEIKPGVNADDFPFIRLTAKAQPKKFGEFLSVGTTSGISESISFALNDNINFRDRFIAQNFATNVIELKALKPGEQFSLSFTAPLPTGITEILNTPGTNEFLYQEKYNYSIWADLYMKSDGTYGETIDRTNSFKIASFEKNVTDNNTVIFDVAGIAKNFVLNPGPVSGMTFTFIDAPLTNLYVNFGDSFSDLRNTYKRKRIVGTSENRWIYNSAFKLLGTYDLDQYVYKYSTPTISGLNLSKQPTRKLVRLNSETEWLSFIVKRDATLPNTFNLLWEGFFTDGTNSSGSSIIHSQSLITKGGFYNINVSPEIIDIDNIMTPFTGKILDYYTLTTTVSGQTIVEQTYKVDRRCVDSDVDIFWLNTLGGWDSFSFVGNYIKDTDRNLDLFIRPITLNNDTDSAKFNAIQQVNKKTIHKLSTGLIDKEHFDWLNELSLSPDVYYINDLNTAISIIITKITYLYDPQELLYDVVIEFEETINENTIVQ